MANSELGWEKNNSVLQLSGIDYGFFNNNRLSGSIDAYKTKTNDLLMAMSIFSDRLYFYFANVGKTSGWGIDLQVNAVPVETKDFTDQYRNWSMDRNKIDELSTAELKT